MLRRLPKTTVLLGLALGVTLGACGPMDSVNDASSGETGGDLAPLPDTASPGDTTNPADTATRADTPTPPMDAAMPPADVPTPRDAPPVTDTAVPRDVVTPPADAGGPPGNPTLENEILVIVNRNRAMGWTCGGRAYPPVGPLVMNPLLQLAARRHSLDMATRNYFSHNSPEGTTPGQRVAATGYVGSPVGENIAAGNATAAATMTQWMNSSGHCTNIMNGSYRSIGVGYAYNASSMYRHYWTQNFGGR